LLNPKDLYTCHAVVPLEVVVDKGAAPLVKSTIGMTVISYEIRRYTDLRNLKTNGAYQILCTQRVVIPNPKPPAPNGDAPRSFDDYPAILVSELRFVDGPAEILSYFPRTLNSAVSISHSDSDSATKAASRQTTSGSSSSTSNSYGTHASIGFFGEALTGEVGVSSEHSQGSERSRSAATSSDTSSSRQQSVSDSMSVKDWASYSYLGVAKDGRDSSLTWVWGQEYPWNVILYKTGAASGGPLPLFVKKLLSDDNRALPPSELSQYGIDFTMTALWIATGQTAVVKHTMDYYTASHGINGTTLTAKIDEAIPFYYTSDSLDLCRYALDPIGETAAAPVPIVGFVPRQFLLPPVPAAKDKPDPKRFRITATGNNLLIDDITNYEKDKFTPNDKGAGFTAGETALTARFTEHCPSLTMRLSFKVTDTGNVYKLFLKHWKLHDVGVRLTIVINDDTANAIELYVDAREAEGGGANVSAIALRDLNYGSVDYHDYLRLGLNEIVITAAPISSSSGATECEYQIRAISIERA
jgi:hypothetical protein